MEGITVKKSDDMAEWYSQICLKSELAEYAPVKGCYIIRPRGYYIWEVIQNWFNDEIRKRGVENGYFPLFIPESFFKKEAEHAEGFNPEVAWIANKDEGERLAVRPTSETIMYDSYAKWIRSHRDLPLRINQWANVVRWETEATKLFLRSREFLWQEGHCVYETEKECDEETLEFLKVYEQLCREVLALPVIMGRKTDKEKFAGAKYTLTIEGFMPDGKALQSGTTHNLGQGFAKAFGISYKDENEKDALPWQSSWGISTRLIGGMVMTHSDDKGLVIPPKVAKNKIVVVPIIVKGKEEKVLEEAKKINESLSSFDSFLDDREGYSSGWKFNEWELKGIPIRVELGPRDLEKESCVVVRRDTGEKKEVKLKDLKKEIPKIMDTMQKEMYEKAKAFVDSQIVEVDTWEDFEKNVKENKLILMPHCGKAECEDELKEKTQGVSSRCIPLDCGQGTGNSVATKCVHCGREAKQKIYFSRSY